MAALFGGSMAKDSIDKQLKRPLEQLNNSTEQAKHSPKQAKQLNKKGDSRGMHPNSQKNLDRRWMGDVS